MPPVLVGAVVSGFIAGSTLTAVGFSLAAFAGSLILGGLSYALTPKPKKPSFSNGIASNTVAVRQSDLSRQHVYGHTRITRGLANMEVTGTNKKLHTMIMLCEGELRAINEIWVDDYIIPNDWLDEDGNVTEGRYKDKLRIRKHLGSDTQDADSVAILELEDWTADHRLLGIAYLYITMTKDQDIYPNGVPNFSAVVEGPTAYDPRIDDQRWTTNTALYASDFLRSSLFGFGISDDDIDNTNVAAQANICDEIVATETITMPIKEVDDVPQIDIDTNIITLDGDLLNVQFGDRVQITSTATYPGGLAAATNYYVIPYQIKTKPRILLATSLNNAMAKIAIDITSVGSGTLAIVKNGEPRYHGGGIIDTETSLNQTLNDLCNSMAGRAVCIGGFWTLLAGAWRTPANTYGISEVRSAIGFKNALSMAESFNIVKGLFISQLNAYQASDYPSAKYLEFIEQDNDIEAPKEVNLPFTTRPTTAQRIAKIELFRGRQDISFKADFSMITSQNQPGDNIGLTIDKFGWENKYFEITEFSFNLNNNTLVTTLTLRETAQEIFDWTSGEAIDYDPAPNTNLPNPFLVQAVSGLAYSSRQIETGNGDQIFTLSISWDQHPDNFVTQFGNFEIQFKLSSESDWRPSFFVQGALTQSDLLSTSVNIEYDIRIRAINSLGVRSSWQTILGAIAGSSGGIGTTNDWGNVFDAPSVYFDWGNVYDTPTPVPADDWGYVV